MQQNLQQTFLALKIITVKLLAGNCVNYDKNTSDRPSTC